MVNKNLDDFNQRFGGIIRLYGKKSTEKIRLSRVMIVGIGGVGSWSAEALARTGIGTIILVDLDDVCITNINRQICATSTDIGKLKIDVIESRIKNINPYCNVIKVENFLTKSSVEEILNQPIDVIIDAIDSLDNKCLLIAKSVEKKIPIITTGGAAGKSDPSKIKIDDLGLTINDSLLQRMRKKLRREFGFQKLAGSSLASRKRIGIKAVYSLENPVYPTSNGETCSVPDSESNLVLDCESGMGSVTHITGTFGFLAAHLAIESIIKDHSNE